jgi:5'-nucleotidase
MEKNIVISNPEKLEQIKKSISKGRAEDFFVLSDFDRTLTKAFVDGQNTPSVISILRDVNFLTPSYTEKAQAFYNKYRPIETDPKIKKEEKEKLMLEWWNAHFDLLINSGLNKKDLEKIVNSGKMKFREGFEGFSEFLNKKNIPLIIISSSGIGGEVISMFLKKVGKLYSNIQIVSNSYEWDEDGKAVAIKRPIIHAMNKNGELIKLLPIFRDLEKRKNILLLGDSLDDIDMTKSLDYENLIKISFLNENIEECLDKYKAIYDIIALNDSPMFFVNNLLKEMIK